MKLAYVVDVHDQFESVPRVLEKIGDVDVLLVGGDITTAGTPDAAQRAIELWKPLVPSLFAVAGNMDSPAIDERLEELGVALSAQARLLDGIAVGGVSAAPRSHMATPYELDDDELTRRAEAALARMRDARVRIFCPHAPPYETRCDRLRSGEHVGSAVLRRLVEREQPDVVLCGHIHEARAIDRLGSSTIVNPGPVSAGHYALVDTDGDVHVALD